MSDILDNLNFEETELNREKEWALYIGPHADYYVEKWRIIESQGIASSFNVAAFFLGVFWMLYRRMYYVFFIYLAILLGLGMIQELTFSAMGTSQDMQEIWDTFANIFFATVTGFLGNWLYYVDANRKIQRIKAAHFMNANIEMELQERGGTSWLPVVIGLVAMVGLVAMMLAVAGESF